MAADAHPDLVRFLTWQGDSLPDLAYEGELSPMHIRVSLINDFLVDALDALHWLLARLHDSLNQDPALPPGGSFRVPIHFTSCVALRLSQRGTPEILPSELIMHVFVLDEILRFESDGARTFIAIEIVIPKPQINERFEHGHLTRQEELFIEVDRVTALVHRNRLRFQLLLFEVDFKIRIDLRFRNEIPSVHCGQVLRLEASNFDLVKLWVQRGRHHDVWLLV